MQNISEIILRFSLAFLLLYFGFSQIISPESWVVNIELPLPDSINLVYVVLFNGAVEIFFGILIAGGVWLKFSSILMGLHILSIAISIGFNPTGIRDLALAGAFFALATLRKK